MVVIQGLASPPQNGAYPNGEKYQEDPEAELFFREMKRNGYSWHLSAEDTGPARKNHRTDCETEWSVVFYRDIVKPADDLPGGFLADDLTRNKIFYRVPHAHPFRTADENFDFVLININLLPDPPGGKHKWKKRKKEWDAILQWIYQNDKKEKDFIIVGNTQIRDGKELYDILPEGFVSLNDELEKTNIAEFDRAFDHVLYRPMFTSEVDSLYDQREFPLLESMMPLWKGPGPFPGSPLDEEKFADYFSNHRPIWFRVTVPKWDDD
jgi:hypothetical protein